MSVRALSRVWEHSQHGGTELLMLLAIADFANDEGTAYPAVTTLAAKCRMKPRNANLLLARLRKSGELNIEAGKGPIVQGGRLNVFRITLPVRGVQSSAGLPETEAVQDSAGVQEDKRMQRSAGPPRAEEVQRIARRDVEDCSEGVQWTTPKPPENRQEPGRGRAKRSPTPACGSRLSKTWTLPLDWAAYCAQRRPDLDPQAVAEDFRDYWIAQPGVKGCKHDWEATWKVWVRRQYASPPVAGARPRNLLHADDRLGGEG